MSGLEGLDLINSWTQEIEIMESHIRQKAVSGAPLHILEAGCGRNWMLKLEGIRYVLTGVDLDRAALEVRKTTLKDLDEIFEGDLRYVDLGENRFDVIYNSFVLEHIEGAEVALRNFVKWLKPDGLIIIRIPDPNCVYGFITRISPHWFHVFYYRRIFGYQDAGKPGHAPYRAYYDPVVSRKGIRRFCQENNLTIEAEYGEGYLKVGSGITQVLINLFTRMAHVLSLGFLSFQHTGLLYVLHKEQSG